MLRIWRCDCALCVIGNEFTCRQPHNPSASSYEGLPLCPKDKNHSPFHGEKPLKIVIYRLKAICPYAIMRPPVVADINHRICEGKRDSGIFIFAFSDNLISKYWFFAEGERFLSFWRCHRPRKRAALGCVVWLIQALSLKSDMPQRQRQVRSTGIAKRLFFMFFVSVPPCIFPLSRLNRCTAYRILGDT